MKGEAGIGEINMEYMEKRGGGSANILFGPESVVSGVLEYPTAI